MKHFLFLVLILAALSAQAHASDDVDPSWHGLTSFRVTGNALVDACSKAAGNPTTLSIEDMTKQSVCYAYIHGALDGQFYTAADGHVLCIPDGVTNEQLVKVVMKYANDHPAQLNRTAFFVVERAVAQAWGEHCK